jgi:hypothetical protein
MGRVSRRSVISSGKGLGLGGGTSSLSLGFLAAHCALLAFCFVRTSLGAAATLGADVLALAFSCASFGASATARDSGAGEP